MCIHTYTYIYIYIYTYIHIAVFKQRTTQHRECALRLKRSTTRFVTLTLDYTILSLYRMTDRRISYTYTCVYVCAV